MLLAQSELKSLSRAFSTHRLQRAHLHAWQAALAQRTTQRRKEALADRWRARRTKRAALSAWFGRLDEVRALDARAAALLRTRQARLTHAALKHWVLAERGALLLRKNQQVLCRLVLEEWAYQLHKLLGRLRERETKLTVTLDANALRRTWETWLLNLQQRRRNMELAQRRDARLSLGKAFGKWRARKEECDVRAVKADILSEYVAERAVFETWKVNLRERRVQRVERRRDGETLRNALGGE